MLCEKIRCWIPRSSKTSTQFTQMSKIGCQETTCPTTPPVNALRVNGTRLWSRLMAMAQIGATAQGGCNRQALTDGDLAGRELFMSWARAAGCTVRVDAIGNVFARRRRAS